MKTVGQILIILIAALLVIGAAYALSQTATVSALVGQPMNQSSVEGQSGPPDFANGQGAARGGDHEGSGGSWAIVGRNLLEMVVIVAAVQGVWAIGRRIQRVAERNNRLAVGRSS
jgi:hypothetical protein